MSVDIANQLFLVYLGRPADVTWRTATADLLKGAAPSAGLQSAFYNAAVVDKVFSTTDTISQLVNKIFINLGLNGAVGASSFEQAAWSDLVTLGVVTKEGLAWTIFSSYLGATNVPASYQVPVQSKLIAVNAYTNELLNNSTANAALSQLGGAGTSSARAVISVVVDQATAAAAVTGISAAVSGAGTQASTFTLTTGADVLSGTAGPDLFVATDSTLGSSDVINGGAGIDILQINTAGGTAVLGGAKISNIETINVRVAAGVTTIDASQVSGLTQVNTNQSAGALTVTKLATGAAVGLIGNGTTNIGVVNLGYATASDAATINISGGTRNHSVIVTSNPTLVTVNTSGDTTAAGGNLNLSATASVTSLTINAASGKFVTGLTNAAFATQAGVPGSTALKITGAGAVDVGTNGAFTTIDASGNSGGVTVGLSQVTTSFKGSTGNDLISTANLGAGASLATSTAGAFDAGAGNDTLAVRSANDVATTAQRAVYAGFEVVRNSVAATTIGADGYSGVTALETDQSGAGFNKISAALAGAITVLATNAGATFTLTDATGKADVLSLTAKSATATQAVGLTGLIVDGFETLNVTESSGSATLGSGGAISFGAPVTTATLSKINLLGAFSAQLDITGTGAVKVTSVDASAATAGMTITTGLQTGALVVTGTALKDAITVGAVGGTGTVAVSAGAGDDGITGTQASITAALSIDGGVGTDTLTLTDAIITVNDLVFKQLTGIEKLAFSTATTTAIAAFTVGGYANAMATGNGGVLDVTAAGLQTGATIDASGLASTNSLKFTGANATGNGTFAITTSNGGADSITISGALNAGTITVLGANNTKGFTVDTSGVTSVAAAGAYTGGSGADTFKISGANTATITGGAGADIITLTAADGKAQTLNVSAAGQSITTAFDVVTNFQTVANNSDQLDFATTAFLTGAQMGTGWAVSAAGVATKAGSSVADFIAAFSASGTAGAVAFSDGTNTWVGYADGTAATTSSDQVVQLAGLTGVGLSVTVAANAIIIV